MKVVGKIGAFLTVLLIWLEFFIVFSVVVIKNVFEEGSLSQTLYLMRHEWTGVIDMKLAAIVLFFCGVLPVVLTALLLWFFKHNYKKETLFAKPLFLLVYLVLLWFAINSSIVLTEAAQCELYAVLFALYCLNQWQDVSRGQLFIMAVLAVGLVFCVIKREAFGV